MNKAAGGEPATLADSTSPQCRILGFLGDDRHLREGSLAQWLGIPKTFGILFLGIGLMVFAVWLLLNAARKRIRLSDARMAVAMDLAWVAPTIPVVVLAPLTSQGRWVVTLVAAVVLSFAVTQWIGIRRISGDSEQRIQEVGRV